ncbi:family 10 glycosylhydrolase [Marinilabiliaceae bacterium ANBcel2]|nr:family 10 glycosylhydrolase [Marinilabiliaceae bacterium ANBcel2]
MNRRNFIKNTGLTTISLSLAPLILKSCSKTDDERFKNYAWITPQAELPDIEWAYIFKQLKNNGFTGLFVQIYSSHKAWYKTSNLPMQEPLLDRLIPIAKDSGIELHAWMWTMPNNNPWYVNNHPEFYAVNGKGQPSHTDPAYVQYYKFMCPNQQGVQDFITSNVNELSNKEGLDGIHFDYIRLPDVIIAEALQPVYDIVQDREYPEYDYCYCEVCRNLFKKQTGIDPLKDLKDPSANQQWLQFRYDSVTNLVNKKLIPLVKESGKQATAAVFPNWESVRQEWSKWKMDAYFPMLYHNFYNESIEWIGDNLKSQINALKYPAPVYSGLFIPSLSSSQLKEAIKISRNSGASGISLFSYNDMNDKHFKIIKKS